MKFIEKWKSLSENRRFWTIFLIFVIVLGVLPRVNLPDPIPYPDQYPLRNGSYEQGIKAYKAGKYGLALANFIAAASYHSDIHAMSMTSKMYDTGRGVQHDICQGTYWAYMAARHGSSLDQERVSQAYYYSLGVERDDEKAYFWARAAVDNKDKSINWYEKVIGRKVLHPPAEWLKFLNTNLPKKDITHYNSKYAFWSYKQASPVNIMRIKRLPYIGMSPSIVGCDHGSDDDSIYARF